jgi:hypothetical protein
MALRIKDRLWKQIRRLRMPRADWDQLHDRLKRIGPNLHVEASEANAGWTA